MSDLKVIDTDWLQSQYKGNMKDLLVIYKKENDECMLRIQHSIESHNHDDIRAIAHKMKGSSRIIGAFVVESLANHIEKTFDTEELKSKVIELQENYKKLIHEIDLLIST